MAFSLMTSHDPPSIRPLSAHSWHTCDPLSAVAHSWQVLRVWEPGMAPADVLSKTLQPVTDVISAEDRGTVQEAEA